MEAAEKVAERLRREKDELAQQHSKLMTEAAGSQVRDLHIRNAKHQRMLVRTSKFFAGNISPLKQNQKLESLLTLMRVKVGSKWSFQT